MTLKHLFALASALLLTGATIVAQRPPSDTVAAIGGNITVVPITHGTVQLVYGAHVILVDPARSFADPRFDAPPRSSQGRSDTPPPPPPRSRPPGPPTTALYAGLAKPTVILVTDIHEDHFDPDVIKLVRGPGTIVVGPAVVSSQFAGAGTLANGQFKTVDGVLIEAVPMYNLKTEADMAEPFHTRGRGNGYIITLGNKRVYVPGDTACTPEMKMLTNIDVAFLPMNLPFTMSSADATECAKAFKPKVVYPYHYLGPDITGPEEFEKALVGSGLEVRRRDWYVGVPMMHRR